MQYPNKAVVANDSGAAPVAPTINLAQLVIDAALQPIVEAHSGYVFGYEALLRGHDRLGFETPVHLLDHMHLAGALGSLESLTRRRALGRFKAINNGSRALFLNIDGRLIADPEPMVDALLADLELWKVSPVSVCVELSERDDHTRSPMFPRLLDRLHRHGFRVALDDFGAGHSELRLLCDYGIDYIKIDRHFISGLSKNPRKRLFVAMITDLAHILGIRVIAEGVETEDEYLSCVEAGCDLVQGYFVARPSLSADELADIYAVAADARARLRRTERLDEYLVRSEMSAPPAVTFGCKLDLVFDLFAEHPNQSFFPVVDPANVPVGIIHERDLKRLIYSNFGRDLVRNKSFCPSFQSFVTRVPIVDVGLPSDRMLKIFATTKACDAIILTENMRYCGVFSSVSLLKVMNEKQIRDAYDLNPLTELPGNNAIRDFINESVMSAGRLRTLCYFDFDNFKAFNDAYGFSSGDKAIMLFSKLLRERLTGGEGFIGHVGGDDFFAGGYDVPRESLEPTLRSVTEDFAREVAELYSPEHRAAGFILAADRGGNEIRCPLMRCSVAVLELEEDWIGVGPDVISRKLAVQKGKAKRCADGFVWSRLASNASQS